MWCSVCEQMVWALPTRQLAALNMPCCVHDDNCLQTLHPQGPSLDYHLPCKELCGTICLLHPVADMLLYSLASPTSSSQVSTTSDSWQHNTWGMLNMG